jgi:hypothetical protein
MTEGTQPRMARGTKLTAGILAAALFALLAFAPLASATPDPVASGSATVTLNKGFTKYLKTFGIKIQKIAPAKLKGQKLTLSVTGGEMDPTNGLGTLTLGGGLKLKAGKKSTTIKGLVLDTSKSALNAKVGGKKVKLAKLSGLAFTRNGFGVNVTLKKLKLTGAGATQLNKKLGFAKGKPKPFLANKLLGKSSSESQPSTVAIIPANNLVFDASQTLLTKLSNVKANVELISPTTPSGTTFTSPITGGSIAPTATAGVVMSSGGLNLVQVLPVPEKPSIETKITLGAMYVDLSAKTVSVEVVADSNAESPAGSGKFPLKLGNLGRSSIADVTVSGVTADPATRTVSVNSSAVLQPISAEVLQGFVSVYKAYAEAGTYQQVKAEAEAGGATPEEADAAGKAAAKAAGEEVAKNEIKAGEALGNFSFIAQTQ